MLTVVWYLKTKQTTTTKLYYPYLKFRTEKENNAQINILDLLDHIYIKIKNIMSKTRTYLFFPARFRQEKSSYTIVLIQNSVTSYFFKHFF